MHKAMEPVAGMPEPEWEVARLFPARGAWSEEEYLDLETNHLVEFSDGRLEVLPMPTESHQDIVRFLFQALWAHVQARGLGKVLFAALPVRLWRGKFREPDVLFMRAENAHRRHEKFWAGADLVMEVVSADPKDRKRDLVTKRREYARAGIAEYWIVDPAEQRIQVLTLAGQNYQVHGDFGSGDEATSLLLPGFCVSVDAVFTAGS
jgi:Uma2 family endonuclease